MNFIFSFFYQKYFQLPHNYDSNTLSFKVLSRIINKCISLEFSLNKKLKKVEKIDGFVISLTSHGKRTQHVYKTIYSVLREEIQPEKLVLWLSGADWSDSNLPNNLRKLKNWGVEIRFVKDLGPHTKYYYSFKKFKNYRVLTIDDDKLYPSKFFEHFAEKSNQFPANILCAGARIIPRNHDKISYWKWELSWNSINLEEANLIPLGVMGVLYPPSFIQQLEVNLLDIGYREFFTTDDLYLKLLSLTYPTPITLVNQWKRGFLDISESKYYVNLMKDNLVNNDKNWEKVKRKLEIQL
jgi:hypothetical protein